MSGAGAAHSCCGCSVCPAAWVAMSIALAHVRAAGDHPARAGDEHRHAPHLRPSMEGAQRPARPSLTPTGRPMAAGLCAHGNNATTIPNAARKAQVPGTQGSLLGVEQSQEQVTKQGTLGIPGPSCQPGGGGTGSRAPAMDLLWRPGRAHLSHPGSTALPSPHTTSPISCPSHSFPVPPGLRSRPSISQSIWLQSAA